ncbi:hypothetical protein GGR50DRAFT_653918 [Xylaria sp. CBS 124048]|nr:hypothetical protein GGR50DRAFT_653918 [Xylaria sp. CBS 124048]
MDSDYETTKRRLEDQKLVLRAWRQRLPQTDYILSDAFDYLHPPWTRDTGPLTIEPATECLGSLDILPLEVLNYVILGLDIASLSTMQCVNRRAKLIVDSVPQLRTLASLPSCRAVVRGIILIGATHVDLGTLYATLCDRYCVVCGKFGGYIYLITCRRVCYHCFTSNDLFLPMLGKQACTMTGRARKNLKDLPHIRSLTGQYSRSGKICPTELTLWDRAAVVAIQTAKPHWEKKDGKECNPRRFMAIVDAPWIKHPSKVAQWSGRYCLGCPLDTIDPELSCRKQYTDEEYEDHIERYGNVVIWEGPQNSRQPTHRSLLDATAAALSSG